MKNAILKLKNKNFTIAKTLFQCMMSISIQCYYLTWFLVVKKTLNILLATKMIKNRPLCLTIMFTASKNECKQKKF